MTVYMKGAVQLVRMATVITLEDGATGVANNAGGMSSRNGENHGDHGKEDKENAGHGVEMHDCS